MKRRKFARGDDVEGTDEGSADVSSASASDDSYTPPKAESKAEPKTRGEAFRAARAAGDKTFEFEGKKYTTELAKPKAPKPAAKEEAPAPAKRPGMMARMAAQTVALAKSEGAKARQSNADLGAGNAGPSGTGARITGNPMSPAYGQGRTNPNTGLPMKKGGAVKKYASGGSVSASSRADGCAQRGKTRGMIV